MSTISVQDKSKILVVVAHTDDELIFFGDMINYHANKGDIVGVASMSNDREEAFKTVCKKLGSEFAVCYSVPYSGRNKYRYDEDSIKNIEAMINEAIEIFAPKIVFTHGNEGEYGNAFHIRVAESTKRICKKLKIELYQRVLTNDESGYPNQFEFKEDLLNLYKLPKPESWSKYLKQRECYEKA